MANPNLRLVAPSTENRTVATRRPKNGVLRTREHLTIDEVERLINGDVAGAVQGHLAQIVAAHLNLISSGYPL